MAIASNFPTIRPSLNLDFANTKTLDPRITFSRASAATYYDGKTVAKAEENLLTYSQEFGNAAWLNAGVSATANAVSAPDGTSTADTITANGTTNYHSTEQNRNSAIAANTASTLSVFIKAGTHSFATLILEGASDSAWAACTVDLSAGVVTKTGAGPVGTHLASSIIAFANGWYRVVLTGQANAVFNKLKVSVASSGTPTYGTYGNDVWTPTGSETIHVWGAQLEQRSQVTAYTPTTSQPITDYIPVLQTAPAGVPRFDHNPVTGESLGLLVEEQRTNLLTYSEQFDNALWVKNGVSIQQNSVVSPDGTLTADKVIPDASNVRHFAYYLYSFLSQSYNYSIYVKSSGKQYVSVSAVGGSGAYAIVDLFAGSITSTAGLSSYSIQSVGDGWYRVSISWAASAGGNAVYLEILGSPSVQPWIGNGFDGVFAWGAQLEAGAFPTSYIKTEASQVTRAVDSASMTGTNFSSWYKTAEGTLYVEGATGKNKNALVTLRAGASNYNEIITVKCLPSSGGYRFEIRKNNTNQATIDGSTELPSRSKMAMAFSPNMVYAAANGASTITSSTAGIPDVNSLLIGSVSSAVEYFNGAISKIAYYPKRLSDAQLQALTA